MGRGTIAVTGATGNIGGAVMQGLLASGETDVIALVRDPSRLRSPLAPSARVADYSSRADLRAALDGVSTLVFIPSDGEAAPMLVHHINILDAAAAAGVSHVLFLSMVDLGTDSPFCFAAVYRETERQLRDSGLSHTLLRAPIYAEFFVPFIVDAAKSGSLSLPTGSGVLSLISRADVAACLVSVLAREPAGPYVITGDRGYDLENLADLTSQLAGTPVRAVDIGASEFCGRLLLKGMEPWWAYAFTSMFEAVGQDRFAVITDTVATLLGRPPVLSLTSPVSSSRFVEISGWRPDTKLPERPLDVRQLVSFAAALVRHVFVGRLEQPLGVELPAPEHLDLLLARQLIRFEHGHGRGKLS